MEHIDLKYFGEIISLKNLCKLKYVEFPLYQAYQKSLHLNRTVISGANGLIKLNIPIVKGRDQKTELGLVRVSYDESWRQVHWKAIISSYRKSPWFDHYHDAMSEFFKLNFEFLFEWNLESLKLLQALVGFELEWRLVSASEHRSGPFFEPTQPKGELEHHQTEAALNEPKKEMYYPQVFEDRFGFIPGLSILDHLFAPAQFRRRSD